MNSTKNVPILNGRDWTFVCQYVAGPFAGNAARAYAVAMGRDPRKLTSADAEGGRRLLARQDVADTVARLRMEVREVDGLTIGEHLAMLATLRDEARDRGQYGAATRAESLRGRAAGFYIERMMTMAISGELSERDLTDELTRLVREFPELKSVLLDGDEPGGGTPNAAGRGEG